MTRWTKHRKADALDFGFTLSDTAMLREYEPSRSPNIQVFTDAVDEEEEQQNKYCPKCESILDKAGPNIGIWLCGICGTTVNSFDYDKPLDSNKQQGLTIPIDQRGQYASYTPEDEIPFFRSFEPGGPNEYTDWQTTYSSENGRIKHIRLPAGVSPYSHSIQEEVD